MNKVMNKIVIEFPKKMDSKEARKELGQAVYKASVQFYENIGEQCNLTDGTYLAGNGHHMAQNMAEQAQKLWDERLMPSGTK